MKPNEPPLLQPDTHREEEQIAGDEIHYSAKKRDESINTLKKRLIDFIIFFKVSGCNQFILATFK